jgi:hypothetical protein
MLSEGERTMRVGVACAKCNVSLRRADIPADRLFCPSCGEGDTVANIRRELAEFRQRQAQGALQRAMKHATPARGFIRFRSKDTALRFRFVMDKPKLKFSPKPKSRAAVVDSRVR